MDQDGFGISYKEAKVVIIDDLFKYSAPYNIMAA